MSPKPGTCFPEKKKCLWHAAHTSKSMGCQNKLIKNSWHFSIFYKQILLLESGSKLFPLLVGVFRTIPNHTLCQIITQIIFSGIPAKTISKSMKLLRELVSPYPGPVILPFSVPSPFPCPHPTLVARATIHIEKSSLASGSRYCGSRHCGLPPLFLIGPLWQLISVTPITIIR